MKLSALVLLVSLLAASALSCGGGGGDDGPPPPEGPSSVIAFGAQDAAGAWALYLVKPDGSGRESLVTEPARIDFPVWSPGAGRIAYYVRDASSVSATLRVYSFETGAGTISVDALFDPQGPALSWSPDAQRLAFITSDGHLAVYDFEAAGFASLPSVEALDVDWGPDDRLAIVTGDSTSSTISLVSDTGEDASALVNRSGQNGGPSWSPDGDLLAFWGAAPGATVQYELLTVPADGGDPNGLAPGSGAVWRPDGGVIAFSAPASPDTPADLDIFTIDREGGDAEALSQSPTRDRWPSWSPDGGTLSYHAEADASTAYLCSINLELEARDCLDLGVLFPTAAAWSPR